MKKKTYLIEFTYFDGQKEEVSLTSDNIEWSIEQYSRNRKIVGHQILNEGTSNSKQMLFG
jgi:hypothetical protein